MFCQLSIVSCQLLNVKVKLATITFIILLIITAIYIPRTRYSPGTSDAYWHLAIGRYVWQEKKIPDRSPFVFAYENTNFTSTEWLAGLIYYLTTLTPLGLTSVLILRSILTVITVFILKKTLDLTSQNQWLNIAAAAAAAYLLGFRAATDRPEILSYLFLAFVNYVCFYFYKTGKLSKLTYFLPLIFLAWPNVHAFGAIGTALLLAAVGFGVFDKTKRKSKPYLTFFAISAVSILAAISEFNRFFYFVWAGHIAPFDIKELASLTGRLSEIKFSPLTQTPPEIYLFFAVLALFLILAFFDLKNSLRLKKYPQLIVSLFFLAVIFIPFKYYRLITPAIILSLPKLTEMTDNFLKSQRLKTITSIFTLSACTFLMVWSIFLGFIVGSRNTWQYVSNLSNSENKIVGVRNHSWTDEYPYKTNKAIEAYLAPNRIFTSNPWRSYYIWYFPQIKVPSDVIFEYQTKQGFDDEEKVRFGQENWQEIFEKYNVDTVVNAPFETSFANVTPINKLPGWKLIYVDEIANIWAKDSAIKNTPPDLSLIHPELNTPHRFKEEEATAAAKQMESLLAFDTNNLFARQQLILYYLDIQKDYQKALELAAQSHKVDPKYPYFSVYLAKANALLGNCQTAQGWGQEAKTRSFNDIIIEDQINNALIPCN